jgi:hypothetical protein
MKKINKIIWNNKNVRNEVKIEEKDEKV